MTTAVARQGRRRYLEARLRGSPAALALLGAGLAVRDGARAWVWARRRHRAIDAYLGSHPIAKLQLGGRGTPLEGWLNTDLVQKPGIVYLDVRRPFPIPDSSFQYVFHEHLLEHLPWGEGRSMLAECRRVLRPGGRLRVATPNLASVLALAQPGDEPLKERYVKWSTDRFLGEVGAYRASFVINNFFRNWGHQFIYDAETLREALVAAGFEDIRLHAPGESDDPELRDLEQHWKEIGKEMNDFETMVFEGTRRS